MSSAPSGSNKIAKVAGGALGGAIASGLVSVVPGVPTIAAAVTFVAVFGFGVYEAFKDMFN
jgi:hypothetical protein